MTIRHSQHYLRSRYFVVNHLTLQQVIQGTVEGMRASGCRVVGVLTYFVDIDK